MWHAVFVPLNEFILQHGEGKVSEAGRSQANQFGHINVQWTRVLFHSDITAKITCGRLLVTLLEWN